MAPAAMVLVPNLGVSQPGVLERQHGLPAWSFGEVQRDTASFAGEVRAPGEDEARVALDLEVFTAVRQIVAFHVHHDQEFAADARIAFGACHPHARAATHEALERL